jgi:uncharacterized small protein (DUF1192 family)
MAEGEMWDEYKQRIQDWLLSQPDRPEVTALSIARIENRRLHAEIERLRAELADRDAWRAAVMAEYCELDERHCTCVPLLREEIKLLREDLREANERFNRMNSPTGREIELSDEIERLRAESATKSDRIQELEDRISDQNITIDQLKGQLAGMWCYDD